MKQILYIISIALMAAIAFISCKGTSKTNPTEPGIPNFIGTWYYETMTQTVLGTASDTLLYDYINNPQEQQFYEVYTLDSVMTFYVIPLHPIPTSIIPISSGSVADHSRM